jgi:GntR family transcriptional regulator, transcriptional repressor for pyruvate dehydrogenase complex
MAADPTTRPRGKSQTSRVADELLRRIRGGVYAVGDRLPSERRLAEEFKVSRPVVREALSMLTMLQLVDVQVGRGAFVTAADEPEAALDLNGPGDLLDVIDVREVIEVGALRLAQARATPQARHAVQRALDELRDAVREGQETTALDARLHETIIDASDSPILREIWHGLEGRIRNSIRVSPTGRSMSAAVLRDHEALASGIIDGHLAEALASAERLALDNRGFLTELGKRQ